MDETPSQPGATPGHSWTVWRIAPMILFAVILYFLLMALFLGAFLQYVTLMATGETNEQIARMVRHARHYMDQVLDYLVFRTDLMPFPFGDFPEEPQEATVIVTPPPPAPKPRRRPAAGKTPPPEAGSDI